MKYLKYSRETEPIAKESYMKSDIFSHSSVSFQDDGLFIYSLRGKNLVQRTFELKNPWMSTSLLLAMCLSALYVKKVVDETYKLSPKVYTVTFINYGTIFHL